MKWDTPYATTRCRIIEVITFVDIVILILNIIFNKPF